jgi:hypothetical protein
MDLREEGKRKLIIGELTLWASVFLDILDQHSKDIRKE